MGHKYLGVGGLCLGLCLLFKSVHCLGLELLDERGLGLEFLGARGLGLKLGPPSLGLGRVLEQVLKPAIKKVV